MFFASWQTNQFCSALDKEVWPIVISYAGTSWLGGSPVTIYHHEGIFAHLSSLHPYPASHDIEKKESKKEKISTRRHNKETKTYNPTRAEAPSLVDITHTKEEERKKNNDGEGKEEEKKEGRGTNRF